MLICYRWNLLWKPTAKGKWILVFEPSGNENWKFQFYFFHFIFHLFSQMNEFLIRTDCTSARINSNRVRRVGVLSRLCHVKHELTRKLIKSDQRWQISLANSCHPCVILYRSFYCSFRVCLEWVGKNYCTTCCIEKLSSSRGWMRTGKTD